MNRPRVFTSYSKPYDHYVGERGISVLHPEEADRLIRAVFKADGEDFRALTTSWNVKKAQVEGLWSLVVHVGLRLERAGLIASFDERGEKDVQYIIAGMDGSKLWLRVEEAFPPFDFLQSRTVYDWLELEGIADDLDYYIDDPVQVLIDDGILADSGNNNGEYLTRLSWREFRGALTRYNVVVDRATAYRVHSAGRVKSGIGGTISLLCPVFLVSSIPVMIWWSIWIGLAIIVIAIVGLRWAAASLRLRIFRLASSGRDDYRWLLSRSAIWLTRRN